MPYLVKIARRGWLTLGRVVKTPDKATVYNSPSAAQKAINRAQAAGVLGEMTIHQLKKEHRTCPPSPTASSKPPPAKSSI